MDSRPGTTTLWAVTPEKVREVVKRVVDASHPRKVILFGSYVKEETGGDSDLDVLVITREDVDSPRRESVRIRRALKGIVMPVDILVLPESRLDEVSSRSDLIYREALSSGRVVYDSDG